jgi:hypothetical protein
MADNSTLKKKHIPKAVRDHLKGYGKKYKFRLSPQEEKMLRRYIIPVDFKHENKLPDENFYNFDSTHGAGHMMYVLRRCKLILDRLGDGGVDTHFTYTMAGLHDAWRAWDIDKSMYDATCKFKDIPGDIR